MEVNLTERQREYVLEYQRILNRLSDIQAQVSSLGEEAEKLVNDLKDLRAKEHEEFPDDQSLIQDLEADS